MQILFILATLVAVGSTLDLGLNLPSVSGSLGGEVAPAAPVANSAVSPPVNPAPVNSEPIQTKLAPAAAFLRSGAVYQVLNKFDNGVLTVDDRSMGSIQVFLRQYNSTAGQKWRLTGSSTGFELSPTSNEKATLDLDRETLGVWDRLFSFGSQKTWNLRDMGEGFVQIRNKFRPDFCLTSTGLEKLVQVTDCQNSPSQQWIFSQL